MGIEQTGTIAGLLPTLEERTSRMLNTVDVEYFMSELRDRLAPTTLEAVITATFWEEVISVVIIDVLHEVEKMKFTKGSSEEHTDLSKKAGKASFRLNSYLATWSW